jgi:hypothetical protein
MHTVKTWESGVTALVIHNLGTTYSEMSQLLYPKGNCLWYPLTPESLWTLQRQEKSLAHYEMVQVYNLGRWSIIRIWILMVGGIVSLWNVGLLEPPDVAVSPRKCYWIYSLWSFKIHKLQTDCFLHWIWENWDLHHLCFTKHILREAAYVFPTSLVLTPTPQLGNELSSFNVPWFCFSSDFEFFKHTKSLTSVKDELLHVYPYTNCLDYF